MMRDELSPGILGNCAVGHRLAGIGGREDTSWPSSTLSRDEGDRSGLVEVDRERGRCEELSLGLRDSQVERFFPCTQAHRIEALLKVGSAAHEELLIGHDLVTEAERLRSPAQYDETIAALDEDPVDLGEVGDALLARVQQGGLSGDRDALVKFTAGDPVVERGELPPEASDPFGGLLGRLDVGDDGGGGLLAGGEEGDESEGGEGDGGARGHREGVLGRFRGRVA